MATTLEASSDWKYLINADGTIRVATQSRLVVEEGAVVFRSKSFFKPSTHFYDFPTEQVLPYTPEQLLVRQEATDAARASDRASRAADRARLKTLVQSMPQPYREAFVLFAKLVKSRLND